jgi:hypothetical protein
MACAASESGLCVILALRCPKISGSTSADRAGFSQAAPALVYGSLRQTRRSGTLDFPSRILENVRMAQPNRQHFPVMFIYTMAGRDGFKMRCAIRLPLSF